MAEFTFYCKVTHDGGTNSNPGIYSFISAQPGKFRLIGDSIKVWRQGPKGGVKIFKDRTGTHKLHRYVTNNEEQMKEFFWIKLQAQPL